MQGQMNTQQQMGQPQQTMVVQQPMGTMQMQPQTGQPMQVVVVQQPGPTTNYASKREAIEAEYANIEQACPVGNFMIWALVSWSLIILYVCAWCIFCFYLIILLAGCVAADVGDDTTDNVVDAFCTLGMALVGVLLGLALYELCVASLIVHGIRNYQHGMCIFGCIWAGLGCCSIWAVVGAYAWVSWVGFFTWLSALVFTAFHTHYIGKAQQVWYAQNRR